MSKSSATEKIVAFNGKNNKQAQLEGTPSAQISAAKVDVYFMTCRKNVLQIHEIINNLTMKMCIYFKL